MTESRLASTLDPPMQTTLKDFVSFWNRVRISDLHLAWLSSILKRASAITRQVFRRNWYYSHYQSDLWWRKISGSRSRCNLWVIWRSRAESDRLAMCHGYYSFLLSLTFLQTSGLYWCHLLALSASYILWPNASKLEEGGIRIGLKMNSTNSRFSIWRVIALFLLVLRKLRGRGVLSFSGDSVTVIMSPSLYCLRFF